MTAAGRLPGRLDAMGGGSATADAAPRPCSPVIAGMGLAVFEQGFSWVAAILALVVAWHFRSA